MSGVLEWLPLALEAAKEIETLSKYLFRGTKAAVSYGPGIEKIRLDLEMESNVFVSFKNILFGLPGQQPPATGLFSSFPVRTQIDIFNRLRLLKGSLESKLEIIDQRLHATRPSLLQVTNTTVGVGSYHQASFFSRLGFGFSTKSKLEKAATEIRCGNERLESIIQLQWLQTYFIAHASRPVSQVTPTSLRPQWTRPRTTSTSLDLPRFLLTVELADTAQTSSDQSIEMDLSCSSSANYDFRFDAPVRVSRMFAKRSGIDVLIEYKSFVPDEHGNPPESSLRRVNRLVNLLHQWDSEKYRTMICQEYFLQGTHFGFTFNIPNSGSCRSLNQLLNSTRPDLDERFFIARELAAALNQLHDVGWLHKSIRSSNILFFEEVHDSTQTDSERVLGRPYVMGWDFARPDGEFSSRPNDDFEISDDIYRHPTQWGLPTDRYTKIHDIYSLGVVLLEIGMWKPALRLHPTSFDGQEVPSAVRQYWIEYSRKRLVRAELGRRYQAIVLNCLEGKFDVGSIDVPDQSHDGTSQTMPADPPLSRAAAQERVLEVFRKEVLDVLDDIVCHL